MLLDPATVEPDAMQIYVYTQKKEDALPNVISEWYQIASQRPDLSYLHNVFLWYRHSNEWCLNFWIDLGSNYNQHTFPGLFDALQRSELSISKIVIGQLDLQNPIEQIAI